MFSRNKTDPAGIQYLGIAGSSSKCKHAVIQVLQYSFPVTKAKILTSHNHHAFLLEFNGADHLAIKSGFTSGYGGKGPHTFSYVLTLLDSHEIDIDEYEVPAQILERLDSSSLTLGDLEMLENLKPIRPIRWHDYILETYRERVENHGLYRAFPPIIPFHIIDSRIADLARTFWDDPDYRLLTAYRRLEDIVRKRIGSSGHSTRLFKEAFVGDKAKLVWSDLDGSEQTGRSNMFVDAYLAHRNRRAHREERESDKKLLKEFLLLNHLYGFEAEASLRPDEPDEVDTE